MLNPRQSLAKPARGLLVLSLFVPAVTGGRRATGTGWGPVRTKMGQVVAVIFAVSGVKPTTTSAPTSSAQVAVSPPARRSYSSPVPALRNALCCAGVRSPTRHLAPPVTDRSHG
jgi:hypothetical protein